MADQSACQPSSVETSVDDGTKIASDAAMDSTGKNSQEDPELNELLNSALEDFDKMKLSSATVTAAADKPAADTSANTGGATASAASPARGEETQGGGGVGGIGGVGGGSPASGADDPLSAEFTEMFSQQFAAQFEETMASLMTSNPQVIQQFERLAQAADTAGDSQAAQQNFMETLSQTLNDMTQNAEGVQEETLEGEGEGQGAEGQGEDLMLPMMQEMMQTLLSKNVLYPSLKEIAAKYPTYLAENEGKLEASDRDLYQRQYDLMSAICGVYEEEKEGDTAETKTQRFEKLLDLMQQMQELGQPPKDIVGEMAPGLEFDENGMPKLPGMPGLDSSQCRLM